MRKVKATSVIRGGFFYLDKDFTRVRNMLANLAMEELCDRAQDRKFLG